MGLLGRGDPVEVIGPPGLREWLETTLRTSATHLPYPLELREVAVRCDLGTRGDIAIEACPLVHRVPSFAYVLREAPRRGRVDPERARALGVPAGPELGRLAAGETIVLADGRRIEPTQVLGPGRPGRVLALCGDSRDSRVLEEPARRCDVLVHECTYEAAKGEAAHRYGHSTSEDVAALACAIRPALLVLTHFSSRYTVGDAAVSVDTLRREVEERCRGQRVVMAFDGLAIDLPPRRAADFSPATWDERYAARDCVWGSGPNRFVAEALGGSVAGGRALDLACGEGRNAIWLAERGWKVTGVDFSRVAVERARALARERGVTLELREADATQWHPEAGAYDLVLIAYLQIPPTQRRLAFARAADALAPGGQLFAIAHARRNLEEGAGGPRDPVVLWDAEEVATELWKWGSRFSLPRRCCAPSRVRSGLPSTRGCAQSGLGEPTRACVRRADPGSAPHGVVEQPATEPSTVSTPSRCRERQRSPDPREVAVAETERDAKIPQPRTVLRPAQSASTPTARSARQRRGRRR